MARIFAVYDCCRCPLKNYPGLVSGRGAGEEDQESMEQDEDEPNKYFHIQACGPGGIAEADGGFAERLFKICKKHASKEPFKGFISWPADFSGVKWKPGQIISEGGDPYLMPFDLGQKPMEEKEAQLTLES